MTDEELAKADRHPPPWQPENRPRVLALIGKLGEEANELAGICARIVIQGLDAEHSDDGRPNREHLEDEIADLAALTGLAMQGAGWGDLQLVENVAREDGSPFFAPVDGRQVLNYDRVERRRDAKKRFLMAWLETLPVAPLVPEDLPQLLANTEQAASERWAADLAAMRAERDSWRAIAEGLKVGDTDQVDFLGEGEQVADHVERKAVKS